MNKTKFKLKPTIYAALFALSGAAFNAIAEEAQLLKHLLLKMNILLWTQ